MSNVRVSFEPVNPLGEEILRDIKGDGKKERPWKVKKERSLRIAGSLARLDQPGKAARMAVCGDWLEFKRDVESGQLHLARANFCRERLCPMCQWRKSIKVFTQVSQVMDRIEKDRPYLKAIFFTCTVKNVQDGELAGALDAILKGWNRFMANDAVKSRLVGWFRSLEITYDNEERISKRRYSRNPAYYDRLGIKPGDKNPGYQTHHPHMHAIFLVDRTYFDRRYKKYWPTENWVKAWRAAIDADYDPMCWLEKVKPVKTGEDKHKAVKEVAKYTLKDAGIAGKDLALTDRLVSVYGPALKGRRLYAFGGVMKEVLSVIKAEREQERKEAAEEEGEVRGDIAAVLERYRWNVGIANYVRVREITGQASRKWAAEAAVPDG